MGEETASLTHSGPSRSRTCCRHFLLAQLGDGRHVVLGEDSAHAQLQDLLQHYTECPLSPYGEMLTQPLARQVSPYPKSTTEDNVVHHFQHPSRVQATGSAFLILTHDCPHLPTYSSSRKAHDSRVKGGNQSKLS